MTRQSAFASAAIIEESWILIGVATQVPSRPGRERGAQVVGALVVFRQVGAEHRRFAGRLDVARVRQACEAAAPGTGTRRHRPTPDCRAGRARASPPSRPFIIGRPGRSATRQNDSSSPSAFEPALDEVVVADRGAAGRHQDVGAGIARAADRGAGRLDLVRHDAEVDHLGAFARAPAPSARSRWSRRSRRARARCPAASSSSPVPSTATLGRRCTGSVGWLMAAASITSRSVSRARAAAAPGPA